MYVSLMEKAYLTKELQKASFSGSVDAAAIEMW